MSTTTAIAPAAEAEELPVRTIEPVKRRVPLADIVRSRRVARLIAIRDLKIKYKQSLVGPPWLIIQPLGILIALVVAFNGVTKVSTGGVPYAIFAIVGLVVWQLINMTILNGTLGLQQNGQLIRRVASPRVAFITGALLSNLIAPAVIVVGAIAWILASGRSLPIQALLFPLVLVWTAVMTFGVLLILASLAIRWRDVNSMLPFWSSIGPFITPVGYGYDSAPPHVATLLAINPFTGVLEAARWSLLDLHLPLLPMVTASVWTVVLLVAGWRVFTRMETRFADWV
ncbi:MAG: ABC transporter permease [Thermoleophilaceae bacterium]